MKKWNLKHNTINSLTKVPSTLDIDILLQYIFVPTHTCASSLQSNLNLIAKSKVLRDKDLLALIPTTYLYVSRETVCLFMYSWFINGSQSLISDVYVDILVLSSSDSENSRRDDIEAWPRLPKCEAALRTAAGNPLLQVRKYAATKIRSRKTLLKAYIAGLAARTKASAPRCPPVARGAPYALSKRNHRLNCRQLCLIQLQNLI